MRRSFGKLRFLGAVAALAAAPLAVSAATMEIGTTVVNSGADAIIPVRVDADTLSVVSGIDEVAGRFLMSAPGPTNLDFESLTVDSDYNGTITFYDGAGVQVDVTYDTTIDGHVIAPGIGFLPLIERIEFNLVRTGGATTAADDVIMDVTFSSIGSPVSVNPMNWDGSFTHEMRGDGGTNEPFSIGPLGGAVAISAPICEYSVFLDDATMIPSTPAADPADTDPDDRVTGRTIGPAGGTFASVGLLGNAACGFAIEFDSPEPGTFPTPDDDCAAFSPAILPNEAPWPGLMPFVTTNADGTVLVADDCTDFIGAGTGSVAALDFTAPAYYGAVDRSVWLRIGNEGVNDAWVYLLQTGCTYTDPTTTVNIACEGLEVGPPYPTACDLATDMVAGSFNLMATTDCEWTVTVGDCMGGAAADWLVINGGPNYYGNDTVDFLACANTGPERTATIRVEDGQGNCYEVEVVQESGCDIVGYTPAAEVGVPGTGATGLTVDVELTDPNCTLTFASPDPWVTNIVAGPVSASAPWIVTVTYDVLANNGPARNTTIVGTFDAPSCNVPPTFPIDQLCGCVLIADPAVLTPAVPEIGGGGSFDVTDEGCTYTISVDQPWVTGLAAGPFGPAGSPGAPASTNFVYSVDPNPGAPRTAIVTITPVECGEPVTHTICQEGECDIAADPQEIVVPSTYTQTGFDIVAPPPAAHASWFGTYQEFGAPIAFPSGDGDLLTFEPGEAAIAPIFVQEEGFITDLKVEMFISHDRPGDLTVGLLHVESGTYAELIDRPGVADGDSLANGCLTDNIDITLSDDGNDLVEDLCPVNLPMGNVNAAIPNTPLSTFDGIPMRGTWLLIVTDSRDDDDDAIPGGTLDEFELEIHYQPIGCSWEIVGQAVDSLGDPLNGNGIPEWIKITNVQPVVINGANRYIGSGSKHVTFDVLPTPSEFARTTDLQVVPFVSAIGGVCADVLFDDSAEVTVTQWADCLYTVDPKKTVPCLSGGASTGNQFTIQTNQGVYGQESEVFVNEDDICLDNASSSIVVPTTAFGPGAKIRQTTVSVTFNKSDSACGAVDTGLGSPFNNEIEYTLTSPSGTVVSLIPAGYLAAEPNRPTATYTFVAGAPKFPSVLPDLTGTGDTGVFSPPDDSMLAFDDEDPAGNWTLDFADTIGGDALEHFEFRLGIVADVLADTSALNACTWRLDDITSWATVTQVDLLDYPANPGVGEPGHDPNLPVNPVIFGNPGHPADADNYQGSGTAVVTYDVEANPGQARTGWIEIGTEAGLYKHEICQATGCTYTVDPAFNTLDDQGYPVAAGTGSFRLVTGDECCWRVTENAEWLEILTFPQGNGTTTIEYRVQTNTGPERRTWILVTDCSGNIVERHEVIQEPGCDLRIDSFLSTFGHIGGIDSFDVIIGEGCLWTATVVGAAVDPVTLAPFVTINGPNTGLRDGTVTFEVARNYGPARSATIEVVWGAQTRVHYIQQASGCVISTSTPGPFAVTSVGSANEVGGTYDIVVDGSDLPLADISVGCAFQAWVNDDPTTNLPYEWLSIVPPGDWVVDGVVEVEVAPNPGPARTGSIRIVGDNNVLTIVFNQANGCELEALVDADGFGAFVDGNNGTTFLHAGGLGEFRVDYFATVDNGGAALPGAGEEAGCPWVASSNNAPWLTIEEGNDGLDGDSVVFRVEPFFTDAPPADRTGTITVTGPNGTLTYTVVQTDDCEPAIAGSATHNYLAQSGQFVLAGMFNDCPWGASVEYVSGGTNWLSIQTANEGIGNGLFTYEVSSYQVAPSVGATRVARIHVTHSEDADRTAFYEITQYADCDLTITETAEFDHDGGQGIAVVDTTDSGTPEPDNGDGELCAWRISVDQTWVTIEDALSATGDGEISYRVAPYYGGGSRTAIVTVTMDNGAIDTHEITQTDYCRPILAYIQPDNTTIYGTGATPTTASYSHSAQADYVTLSMEDSVAGDENFDDPAVANGCPWTASISYDAANTAPNGWLSIQVLPNGSGNAVIAYEVASYQDADAVGATRSATIRITGENGEFAEHVLTQAADCELLALEPASASFLHDGGAGFFSVIMDQDPTDPFDQSDIDCLWTIELVDGTGTPLPDGDGQTWINIQDTFSGTGNGHVDYEVMPWYDASTTKGGAISRNAFIRVILPNGDFLDHQVTQVDECTPLFDLDPASDTASREYNHSAQADEIGLIGMDDSCPWTVVVAYDGANTSPDGWVSLQVVGDQIGNATLAWEVSAYFDAPDATTPRIATITVTADNGRFAVLTLTQLPDCDLIALSPDAALFDHEGGAGEFEVEFAALSTVDCPWRIEVSESWVNVQEGTNGFGDGHITYDVEPFYFGQAPDYTRTATIRVYLDNGDELIHTITQVDECTPAVSDGDADGVDAGPTAEVHNHSAQSGGFVLSGMTLTCPWNATIAYNPDLTGDQPEWLTLTTAADGVGDSLVTYEVAAYFDDPLPASPRSATITVTSTNGRTAVYTITQDADCDLTALVDDDGVGSFVNGNNGTRFNHEGGAGEFNIEFANLSTVDCPWTIATSAPWVNIQSGIDGVGYGLVSFDVEEYYGPNNDRTAIITVSLDNGDMLTYTVLQEVECVPAVTQAAPYNHSAQNGSFELTGMYLTCPWEADIIYQPGDATNTADDAGWLTLTSGNDGTGNQLVTYSIDSFFSDPQRTTPQVPQRSAIIRITSRTRELIAEHLVVQNDDCDLLPLVPASQLFYQAGGYGEFQVPFAAGGTVDCVFAIVVNATDTVDGTDWISIQTGFDGAGNSIVTYEVEPFFNSCPDEFSRTGTIVLTLPNGDTQTHTVTQNDECAPQVAPEVYVFDHEGGCRTITVFFGNDPDGEYDCHWIARIRYEGQEVGPACDNCTEIVGTPDEPFDEPWVTIMEGSTEGHGDGSVTYCVDDYHDYPFGERIAYIEIIADNCRRATHQIIQRDPCQFCLVAFPDSNIPGCNDVASFTNWEALQNYGIETGILNDYTVEPPTGTQDDFVSCNLEFWYDHQGRLTGPVVDCSDDNTGTGSFQVVFEELHPFEECLWTATVVEGEQWVTIVEGNSGFGTQQVFFEIDPNVVDGPDVARRAIIEVLGENGQVQIVVINQAEGFYALDQFELAGPHSSWYNDYGFNQNTLVIGYTNLSNPVITTDNAGTSDDFVLFDTKLNRTVRVEPDVESDARGMLVGFADVAVYAFGGDDKGASSLLGSFELPVVGRINYSRTAVREVNSPDNNYNGFTTAKYNNTFSLVGKDALRGTFSAKGAEKYTVVPPELNDLLGFQTSTKVTSKLDGAAAKASGQSRLNNWIPTSASLAISKSSLEGTPALNQWTSDLLVLDSDYNVMAQQGGGATTLKTKFIRERGEKAGSYSWTGQLGRDANNRFSAKGLLQLTFEQVSAEGFWLDRPDNIDELNQILFNPAPGRKNPGAIRGLTVFPTNASFSNSQVNIRTSEKWNKNLVLNPVVTTPPPTPKP